MRRNMNLRGFAQSTLAYIGAIALMTGFLGAIGLSAAMRVDPLIRQSLFG